MKLYIKYIVILLAVICHWQARAAGNMSNASPANKPTIKVAVYMTPKAKEVYGTQALSLDDYLAQSESQIRQVLQTITTAPQDYDVEFTVISTLGPDKVPADGLTFYKEPSERTSKKYITFQHEGLAQVFDEVSKHQEIADFLSDPANDSNGDGVWDDPRSSSFYLADKSNLDQELINYVKVAKPDVVIVVANEAGGPVVADETVWDLSATAKYDNPLYAAVSADYFANSTQALTYAFFSLFCRAEHSDADLENDFDPETNPTGQPRSLMSQELTGYEGETRLTNLNKEFFAYNVGKLKVASATAPLHMTGTTIDAEDDQVYIDNMSLITITPDDGATPADLSDDIPAIISVGTGEVFFTTGEYPIESSEGTAPAVSPVFASAPAVPGAKALTIDFETDITGSNFNDYVSDDFGAIATHQTTGGNGGPGCLKVIKSAEDIGKWASVKLSHLSGVTFPNTEQKLSVDIKSPDANTDVTLILEGDDGSRVTKKYTVNDLVDNGWKTVVFDFADPANRTGTINNELNYGTIYLLFNSGVSESGSKIYYVDNIKFSDPGADLGVYIDYYENGKLRVKFSNRTFEAIKIYGIKGVLNYGSNWRYTGDKCDLDWDDLCTHNKFNQYQVSESSLGNRYLEFDLMRLDQRGGTLDDMFWNLSFEMIDAQNQNIAANTFTLQATGQSVQTNTGALLPTNTGFIDSNETIENNDPFLANNTATRVILGDAVADLSFVDFKLVDPCLGMDRPGQLIAKVRNNSTNATASNVIVQHIFGPEALSVINPPVGSVSGTNINFGDIPAGQTKEIVLTIEAHQVLDVADIYTVANIVSDNESDYSNNYKSGFAHQAPNLGINSSDSPPQICENTSSTHTITISPQNVGNCTAKNVVLSIDLPAEASSVTTSIGQNWTGQAQGVWTAGDIAANQSKSLTMTYTFPTCHSGFYEFVVQSDNHKTINSQYEFQIGGGNGRIATLVNSSTGNKTNTNRLYPNPFTREFSIDFESRVGQEQVSLQVYDLAGRVVLSQDIATESGQETQSIKIDGSALPNGAYTYILDIGDSELIRGKLLKK